MISTLLLRLRLAWHDWTCASCRAGVTTWLPGTDLYRPGHLPIPPSLRRMAGAGVRTCPRCGRRVSHGRPHLLPDLPRPDGRVVCRPEVNP